MTTGEIANVLRQAGFPESSIPVMVAIAMGESSGNPRAYNGSGSDDSYGLWQINMKGGLGPARRAQFGLSSNSDLYDPLTNAKIAYALSNGGQNFNAWGAYTNGSYRRYLSAQPAVQGNNAAGGGGGGLDIAPIDTPFGQVNPLLLVGAAVLAYLILA